MEIRSNFIIFIFFLSVHHKCNSDDQCPPCTVLTSKLCMGGHEVSSFCGKILLSYYCSKEAAYIFIADFSVLELLKAVFILLEKYDLKKIISKNDFPIC